MKAGKYEIPNDLLYTESHEWLRELATDEAEVGITHYAAEMLHDVVFVTLPQVGSPLDQGKPAATVESVKSVSDVLAPVEGKVTAVNEELIQHPELINEDPYGRGWFFEIRSASLVSARRSLISPSEYAKLVEKLAAQEG